MGQMTTDVPEVYTGPYGGPTYRVQARRTAERAAPFLLPHLRPGMRLLDCGVGPGTITFGLAQAVAPGEVVGIDLEATEVEQARALASAVPVSCFGNYADELSW